MMYGKIEFQLYSKVNLVSAGIMSHALRFVNGVNALSRSRSFRSSLHADGIVIDARSSVTTLVNLQSFRLGRYTELGLSMAQIHRVGRNGASHLHLPLVLFLGCVRHDEDQVDLVDSQSSSL